MNKTKIPWADYTLNPVKGLCPMACPYCYARRMYKRFKWNPEIRWEPECLIDLSVVPEGSKVFIGSTIELFHEDTEQYMPFILDCVKRASWQTSILLTKQPQNLKKFSPFPRNCWVGTSCTSQIEWNRARREMMMVGAGKLFISFEPLLKWDDGSAKITSDRLLDVGIDWVIIGSQTQPTQHPPREWVEEIITACDNAKIPVFIKEPMASHYGIFRQEFPNQSGVASGDKGVANGFH